MNLQIVIITESEESSSWGHHLSQEPVSCIPICNKPSLWSLLENISRQLSNTIDLFFSVTSTSRSFVETCIEQGLNAGIEWKGLIKFIEIPPTKKGFLKVLPYVTNHLTANDILFLPPDIYGNLPLMSLYELHTLRRKKASHTLSLLLGKEPSEKDKSVFFSSSDRLIVTREGASLLAVSRGPDSELSQNSLKIPLVNLVGRGNDVKIEACFHDLSVYLLDLGFSDVLEMVTQKYNLHSFTCLEQHFVINVDAIFLIQYDTLPFLTAMQLSMTELGLPPLTVLGLPVVSGSEPSIPLVCRIFNAHQYQMLNLHVTQRYLKTMNRGKHLDTSNKLLSLLDESCILEEDVVVKKSCIGARCTIGSHSQVVNTVLQHDIQIGSRVTLFDCLICFGAKIDSDVHMKNCVVASNGHVTSGQYSGRVFSFNP